MIAVGLALLTLFAVITFLPRGGRVSLSDRTEKIKEFYIPFGIMGLIAAAIMVIVSALPL